MQQFVISIYFLKCVTDLFSAVLTRPKCQKAISRLSIVEDFSLLGKVVVVFSRVLSVLQTAFVAFEMIC